MKRLLALLLCLGRLCAMGHAAAEIIPPAAYNQGFYDFTGRYAQDALVLCESLTLRAQPDYAASAVATLAYGDPFVTCEQQDGWLHAVASDGSLDGWVRSEYVLVSPSYLVLDASTPAYAYGDESAPRVALLDAGTQLPILLTQGEWTVVSLRGASAWIHTGAAGAFTPARCASLTAAELTIPLADGSTYAAALTDAASLQQLASLMTAAECRGVLYAGCPFGVAMLTVHCTDGGSFTLDLAADSCCIYRVEGRDYAYARNLWNPTDGAPDNSVLFGLFPACPLP